jgi:hypothetical protein
MFIFQLKTKDTKIGETQNIVFSKEVASVTGATSPAALQAAVKTAVGLSFINFALKELTPKNKPNEFRE